MQVKSILVIGNVEEYTELFFHALMNGYRIIYTEGYKNELSFLVHEDIRLIIIINLNINDNLLDDPHFKKLIKSEIPVIFTKEDGLEEIIKEIIQGQIPFMMYHDKNIHDINNSIKYFFHQKQNRTVENNQLIYKKEKDFVSLELNGYRSVHRIQKNIKKAITFMKKHFNEDISLQEIAQAAFLSPCHFSRMFKKQVGINCCKYLSILRINKAKELLIKGVGSVTEICYEVGFNDLTHFERVFKGLEGTTPSSYKHFYLLNDKIYRKKGKISRDFFIHKSENNKK